MSAGVTVGTLVGLRGETGGLGLDVLAGAAGLERRIAVPFIQTVGLALAGFDPYLRPGGVFVFGASEDRFPERMTDGAQDVVLSGMFATDLPCVLLTVGLDPPARRSMRADADTDSSVEIWCRGGSILEGCCPECARGAHTPPACSRRGSSSASGTWPTAPVMRIWRNL